MFSFCITPKRFLHDLLANHTEAQTSPSLPVEQVTTSGYHCHIDDLVVVAPFLPEFQSAGLFLFLSEPPQFSVPVISFFYSYQSSHVGRGPPAVFYSSFLI